MIKPAQLYEEQLKKKLIEKWYDPVYKYYFIGGSHTLELPDHNYDKRNFVSIVNDEIIGYIAYNFHQQTKIANQFGLISFDIGNLIFIKDLFIIIKEIFEKYNGEGITFRGIMDNPVIDSYYKLCKKYNGRVCGYHKRDACLITGEICDSIEFEIMKEDYFSAIGKKNEK
jgi:hypothetical protein